MEQLVLHGQAALLLSLRLAPTLAFAAPFTLIRIPAVVRMMLALSLAWWLVDGNPAATVGAPGMAQGLPVVAVRELFLGISLALCLQIAFAAILMMGRAIDIQAGFGLAALIEPATRASLPLVGTILAYAAGATFFASGGLLETMAVLAESLERAPLGAAGLAAGPGVVLGLMGSVFVAALGLIGLMLLVFLLIDITIAFLSRTVPQVPALLLGFQVKSLVLLLVLPLALGVSASAMVRVLRLALDTMARVA